MNTIINEGNLGNLINQARNSGVLNGRMNGNGNGDRNGMNGNTNLELLGEEILGVGGELTDKLTSEEVIKRMIKYLVEGGAVAIAAFLIPSTKLKKNEIMVLAVTAATVLAILDTFSPTISESARKGSGFGIGSQLVGGLGGF